MSQFIDQKYQILSIKEIKKLGLDHSVIDQVKEKFKFKVTVNAKTESFKKEQKTIWMESLDIPYEEKM